MSFVCGWGWEEGRRKFLNRKISFSGKVKGSGMCILFFFPTEGDHAVECPSLQPSCPKGVIFSTHKMKPIKEAVNT
jgi:hypothetical protein